MPKYRHALPLLSDDIFIMDAGMETTFIFHEGIDLPCFASFDLMKDENGRDRLRAYYTRFAELACARGVGFVLDAPTWRANADWGARLGFDAAALADVNRRAIDLLVELRQRYETPASRMVVSGVVGPRGDGYQTGTIMTAEQAAHYHAAQIETFADSEADMVGAYTLNYVEEAVGIALAAKAVNLPSVISFTLETDGRLPSGQNLREAVEQVDAESGAAPAYFMINCAHPTHFENLIATGGDWLDRVRGVRANASSRSHAELDAAPDLDAGDPVQLGHQYRSLRDRMRHLTVLGGCCGTDYRHIEQICLACLPAQQAA
ncbi:homocysteine S-methyltransferase family protein [Ancylobacter defluvii]|uniref:Homocysteine S-methyltransferase n=1 Tax=Ancylobacter defluvii TaxID=1282440 RepID=A0A9W6NBI2_9HYPH|nr:homocysteine S-methyltransferase family protein [Ancylobacter defluvii]MBS7588935.1 homocysteine S-methyltransferase family protein [Ancylobacter defluvii]GLK84536.1 homocysteine S-methyltransferase [Ancylobacter defluvii]